MFAEKERDRERVVDKLIEQTVFSDCAVLSGSECTECIELVVFIETLLKEIAMFLSVTNLLSI